MTEGSFFAQNLDLWISIILTLLVVLIGLVIFDLYNDNKLKTRYEKFMGLNKKRKNDENSGNSAGYAEKYAVLLSESRNSKVQSL